MRVGIATDHGGFGLKQELVGAPARHSSSLCSLGRVTY